MAQYQFTANLTNGSSTVQGIGTEFTSEVQAGDLFKRVGDSAWYTVASITSDTELELSAPYAGATESSASCVITRDFTPNYNFPELDLGDVDWHDVFTFAVRKIDEKLQAPGNTLHDQFPATDNTYCLGSESLRWKELHAVDVFAGDIIFQERHCARCGRLFKPGDELVLLVVSTYSATRVIPVHRRCKDGLFRRILRALHLFP